jgi:hypothetical protein
MTFLIVLAWGITLIIGIYISFELNADMKKTSKMYVLFSSDHRLKGVFDEKEMKKTLLKLVNQDAEGYKNIPVDELRFLLKDDYIESIKMNEMRR